MLGELPVDFLRVGPLSQADTDQQYAMALHRQLNYTRPEIAPGSYPSVNRLNVTVNQVIIFFLISTIDLVCQNLTGLSLQAKLVKNYGIARMDPFVRLRVGDCVYETPTDSNGGKNPYWNKTIQWYATP